ncbi:MAG: hypothetical protein RRZ65_00125 [Tannerellaceae bacterium]
MLQITIQHIGQVTLAVGVILVFMLFEAVRCKSKITDNILSQFNQSYSYSFEEKNDVVANRGAMPNFVILTALMMNTYYRDG